MLLRPLAQAHPQAKMLVDPRCFRESATGWGLADYGLDNALVLIACKKEDIQVELALAEALGVRWYLQLAKNQGWCNLNVFTDAEYVVACIYSRLSIASIDHVML